MRESDTIRLLLSESACQLYGKGLQTASLPVCSRLQIRYDEETPSYRLWYLCLGRFHPTSFQLLSESNQTSACDCGLFAIATASALIAWWRQYLHVNMMG